MTQYSPPPGACWFFESLLPLPHREVILGDLLEEYSLRVESTSRFKASRWFWSQACRSLFFIFWSSLRRGNWLISVGIAMSVYIAMVALKIGAEFVISTLAAPAQKTQVVLAPILFLTITSIGGYIAGRIRRGATAFLALIVMITVAVLISVRICTIPVPWWYQFGFLTAGPLAALIAPTAFSCSQKWLQRM